MSMADQRIVGIFEQGDVGDGQGTDGLAVITVGNADEFLLVGETAIAPGVEAHLQGDFDGGGAIGGEEGVPEAILREGGEALGEFDGGLVRAAGEHGVFERIELVFERRVDTRIGVTEQVDPPGADGIEIAKAVAVIEPGAGAAGDGDERHALMVFHLGTGMPDCAEAAGDPVGGVFGAFGAFDAFGCSCVQNCSGTVRRGFSFSLRGVAFCAARGGFWGPDACCLVRFVRCLAAVGGEISAFFMFMHYPSGGGFLMLRVLFGDVVGRFYLIFTDEGFWA